MQQTETTDNTYDALRFYNNELKRLQDKKENATAILSSKQRLSLLNDSYRKRYAKYIQMLVIVIIVFVLYLGIFKLKEWLFFIPTILFDAIFFIVIAIAIFYLFNAFYELYSRSVINYDELDLPAYDASGGNMDAQVAAGRILPAPANGGDICVGQDCCPTDYTWDKNDNICKLPDDSNAFTTIADNQSTKNVVKRTPITGVIEPSLDHTSLSVSKI